MFLKDSTTKAKFYIDPTTGECRVCVNPFTVTTGKEYEALRAHILAEIERQQKGGAA